MKRIVETNSPPYGGMAFYKDPETGITLQHPNVKVLIENATQLRVQNNLPIPVNWEEHVEDNICLNTPGCLCEEADGVLRKALNLAAHFTKSMASWAASGFALVSDEVLAERRNTCQGNEELNIPRCSYYRDARLYFGFGRCATCGCTVGLKTPLASEHCPKSKWKR